MKSILIIISLILVIQPVKIPASDWKLASKWTIYNITSENGTKFDRAAMKEYQFKAMPLDTMREFLVGLAPIPREKSNYAAWMGDYYVSCLLRDTVRFLRLSRYGGFFVDLNTGQYYEIPLEKRTDWHLFLVDQFGAVKNMSHYNTLK